MPEGIAVEIENGFATIAPDADKINEVLVALLGTTPPEMIEQNTRSGPSVQYIVPEGNAREAGLIDEQSLSKPVLDQVDLGPAQALVDADPNAQGETHWHNPQINVAENAYVAGRDGANGILSGPLSVAPPATEVPAGIPAAEETIVELRDRIKNNTIQPADYAPKRSTPVGNRVSSGNKATIATVVTDAVESITQAVSDAVEASSNRNYDDGSPDSDWTRAALNNYATDLGIADAAGLPNKQAVLDAIRAAEVS